MQYDGQCGPTVYAPGQNDKHLRMIDIGIRRIIASVLDIEDKSCGCCL